MSSTWVHLLNLLYIISIASGFAYATQNCLAAAAPLFRGGSHHYVGDLISRNATAARFALPTTSHPLHRICQRQAPA